MDFASKRITAFAGYVCLAAAVAAPGMRPAASAEPPNAKSGVMAIVTKARHACFSRAIRVNGILMPKNEARIMPEVEGFRVSKIMAGEGDNVTAGQELARLTRPDGASVSLPSPVNGTVIKSAATLGALASARSPDPLFRIAVDGDIELIAQVPSIYVPGLKSDLPARVELEDGRDLPGRVRQVPSEINPVSQLGAVRIQIESDPSLRAGTFARATIDAERSCDGVSVPRSAVHFRTEGATVQVVHDDVVETRKIRVGLMSGDSVQVLDGVREGETVIANAGGSLRDGEKVKPVPREENGSESGAQ
ncbi:MAG: efflux RND transporter periplasmic adaptor subunit [Rhodoplanes sp.]|jgi:multidrug efflux pump subunit AcrA (membrane-fusion protein)